MPLPPIIVLAGIMCSTAVVLTAMGIVARLISQRRMASQSLPQREITQRLERIEEMVEATAIEVERLAESNRFVAKLLAEKTGAHKP
jgi:hypothetical protein